MKIYIDWISQPSRAIAAYCLMENIPHEVVQIRVNNFEHRTPEYLKINPAAKVPAISITLDNGEDFNLFESHTIMRFLSDKYNKSTLFPQDNIQLKATVNSYLDWHHTNTRKCGQYIFDNYFAHILGVQPYSNLKEQSKEIDSIIKFIDQVWLKGGHNKFIGNNERLTVADISCYCELSQMRVDNYDFKGKTPHLYEWMTRMEQIPEIQSTHQALYKLAPKMAKNKLQPKL